LYVTEKEIEDEDKKVLLSIILLRNFSFVAVALLLHNFFFSTVTLMASFNAVASIVSKWMTGFEWPAIASWDLEIRPLGVKTRSRFPVFGQNREPEPGSRLLDFQ